MEKNKELYLPSAAAKKRAWLKSKSVYDEAEKIRLNSGKILPKN